MSQPSGGDVSFEKYSIHGFVLDRVRSVLIHGYMPLALDWATLPLQIKDQLKPAELNLISRLYLSLSLLPLLPVRHGRPARLLHQPGVAHSPEPLPEPVQLNVWPAQASHFAAEQCRSRRAATPGQGPVSRRLLSVALRCPALERATWLAADERGTNAQTGRTGRRRQD